METTSAATESANQRELLLVAADLDERRLLLAELLEAGYAVLPLPGLVEALRLLRAGAVRPPLILFDAYSDDANAARLEDLLRLSAGSRLILVVGSMEREPWESLRPRVTALLRRPLTVGEVVDAVRRELPRDEAR